MQRSTITKIFSILLATTLAGAGAILLAIAGLPNRYEFTGYLTSSGAYIAPEIGARAPDAMFPLLDGTTFSLVDQTDKLIVLNFWATWCGPCRAEMADLQAIQVDYGDRIHIIGINTGEPLKDVESWAHSLGLTFDLVIDNGGIISESYRVRGLPTTYVISPSGEVVAIYYGPVTYTTIEHHIQ